MKKIMFNDRFDLTFAVLRGRKTQTRRIITLKPKDEKRVEVDPGNIIREYSNYFVGEEVAIAQNYKEAGLAPDERIWNGKTMRHEEAAKAKGWTNKMFVQAELMLHHIRITNVRIERLQDISAKDVLAEGFSYNLVQRTGYSKYNPVWLYNIVHYTKNLDRAQTIFSEDAQEAYSHLIDHICGVGTWNSNPYVFTYEFELID